MNTSLNRWTDRIWSLLVSRSLSIWLLALVTLMLAAGAFLPDPELLTDKQQEELMNKHPLVYWLGERYNSQRLAKGYFFGFIGVFLVVSTTMCSIDRLVKRKKAKAGYRMYPGDSPVSKSVDVNPGGSYDRDKTVEMISQWFRRRRMRVYETGEMITGVRGEVGFWGSVLFHAVLITALIGLVIYYLGGVRASFNITEGQTLRLEKDSFFYIEKEPLWGLRVPEVILQLLSVTTVYDINNPNTAIDHTVKMYVKDIKSGSERMEIVKINRPLKIGGMDLLLMRGGFTPRIVISESTGKVFDNYVVLRDKAGREDYFIFRDKTVHVELYPDFYMKNGQPASRTAIVRNPHFKVQIKGDNEMKEEIIPLNGVFDAGRYLISIPDMRKWVQLDVVKEPGIGFFFIVSFVGIIGLMIRLLDPEERLYVMLSADGRLRVMSYSKYFPGLTNERMGELIRHLGDRLGFDSGEGRE